MSVSSSEQRLLVTELLHSVTTQLVMAFEPQGVTCLMLNAFLSDPALRLTVVEFQTFHNELCTLLDLSRLSRERFEERCSQMKIRLAMRDRIWAKLNRLHAKCQ
eukprot:TRINITY_DN1480_c0_g1_i4.p2 TRINITY_DN1480_c0_g1~~TRINITY_DN1480_c0_g1_i4.p2  ORF type:complete len:104 (+),score=19.14 TRINITY_DN1480_c0_g1_i4:1422-1733(+)